MVGPDVGPGPPEASGPDPDCIACGGQGCGICKLRAQGGCGKYEPPDGTQLLCSFFPVCENVVEALCGRREFLDALAAARSPPLQATTGGSRRSLRRGTLPVTCHSLLHCLLSLGRPPNTSTNKEPRFFVDLGCGDGRVVIEVASRFECHALGVELDEDFLAEARRMASRRLPRDALSTGRVRFVQEDLRRTDLARAFAVFMFLPAHVSEFVLRAVLPGSSLQPGTPVFVCGKKGWRPAEAAGLAEGGPCYEHAASENVGSSSFGSLHCLRWRGMPAA